MKAKKKNKSVNKKSLQAKTKKSLGELMKDEDGFVSKETILKVGLSTVAALGAAGAITNADVNQTSHNNVVVPHTPPNNCVTHTNVTTHTSY